MSWSDQKSGQLEEKERRNVFLFLVLAVERREWLVLCNLLNGEPCLLLQRSLYLCSRIGYLVFSYFANKCQSGLIFHLPILFCSLFCGVNIYQLVHELLAVGHIHPRQSALSSLVILVKKKNNQSRMYVDYRALNKATILDKFLIQLIEELLDELYVARYFSKSDLKSGYPGQNEGGRYTQDNVLDSRGHYEYLLMPFGLMNAPSIFHSLRFWGTC